ncbi:hypothetical protein [Oceanobacillus halotolerans]|uniref:hypothetical protein n=1 Tax=Oceanobacillus halotolerans TaxID=2663380 RepID=UPI0013DA1338|nr:hypothetical protein [Oceanobacillus halotolerans]
MTKKDIVGLVFLIVITLYFGGTLLSYFVIDGATYDVTEFLLIIALLVAWGQVFTWGTRREVQKDEMGKTIMKSSAHVSYNVVLFSLLTLWVIDFFFISKGENYTLFIALCIAYITQPIIQFILVKRHM